MGELQDIQGDGTALPGVDAATKHRRQVAVQAMMLVRSIRKVNSVRRWLLDPDILAEERDDASAREKIAECREWMVGATLHEAEHGRGSLLDRTHPFWVESLKPAHRRVAEILASKRR